MKIISSIKSKGIFVISAIKWCDIFLQRYPSNILNTNDIVNFEVIKKNNLIQFKIKRLNDIFISFIILFLSLPLLLVVTLTILISEGRPIFYSQTRTGINNKKFTILKFRSMIVNAEENKPQFSKINDSRVTNIGKFLRKYRIDELPQLISVIKGDMSLIGPRPERPEMEIEFKEKIPYYNLRNLVRPGLSGWAQVSYPYGASIEDSINKLSYDLFYVKNFSLIFDLVIFFKTIKLVFLARGSTPKI